MNHEQLQLFSQANEFQRNNQLPQAIALYQQVLETLPNHQDTLHSLGLIYAMQNDMHNALTYLNKAALQKPEASIYNNLANAYKKMNQIDTAIDNYKRALAIEPNYTQAHNNLGSIYAMQNKYHEALKHYVTAIREAPDFSNAHFNLGVLFLRNNELAAALTQFNNVLTLHPEHTQALFYSGVLNLEKNNLDLAENAFHLALEQDSELTQAIVNLGVIALKREQNQLAVDYFSKALALDNDNTDARNNLAATFMHHDRFENALMHYDVLLQQDPNNTEYLYNSGVAEMALGHLDDALQYFTRLINLEPTHTASLNNVAAIYLKWDMRETAAEYLERALSLNQDDTVSAHMLSAIKGKTEANTNPTYAQNLFNNYALYYDEHMNGALNYTLPTAIAKIIHQLHLLQINQSLDLGCGTGLSGVVLREISKHVTGIDLSEKMLAHARKKGLYDVLAQAELIDFLQTNKDCFGLILAADVIPYLGNLTPLFEQIETHLEPGGYYIFSTEINEQSPWQLEKSARFSHQPEYIQSQALAHNLTIIQQEKAKARMQNNTPLEVMIYVCQKGKDSP